METVYPNNNYSHPVTVKCFLSKNHGRRSCKFIFLKSFFYFTRALGQSNKCFRYWSNFLCSKPRAVSLLHLSPSTHTENYIISVSITSWKIQDHFQGKGENNPKETLILNLKFPEMFFPSKSHRVARYTHTAMTPFTVGPLCPAVLKSK